MVKKHEKTKTAHKQGSRAKSSSMKRPLQILIILIVLAAIIYGATTFLQTEKTVNPILVTINGEPLYETELDTQWKALPVQAKLQITREELLEQLVDERLLLQEAVTQEIIVSDEDVTGFLELQLAQTGRSEEEFAGLLKAQGTTVEDIKAIYKRQLTIAKLFDTVIGDEPVISSEIVLNYYEEHKEDFYRDEQVTVRHILLQENEERDIFEFVEEIEVRLDATNNENFCDLVNQHSMDLTSREQCGAYTFQKGVMVPEFENASFSMDIGERKTVKSDFGYHIIIKDAAIPAGHAQLSDVLAEYPGQPTVQQLIEQVTIQQKAKEIFDTYVGELKAKSVIEYN